jgi:hypothetical protein
MVRPLLVLSILPALACSSAQHQDPGGQEAEAEAEAESEGEGAPVSCADPLLDVGGVCVRPTSADAARTMCGEITEYCACAEEDCRPECTSCSGASLDVSCVEQPYTAPAGPATATLAGYLDVFGNGPDADGVVIEVFDAVALAAAAAAALAAGTLGYQQFVDLAPLGTATVELTWNAAGGVNASTADGPCRACPEDETLGIACDVPLDSCDPPCDLGADYCADRDPSAAVRDIRCIPRLRWECRYRIDGVPTNTLLAVRTSGVGGFTDGSWSRMVQYNVYVPADQLDGGAYEQEVNVLHNADYGSIPRTVIGAPVPGGRGAVAGEIHDCQDVRVENAQVGIAPRPAGFSYFNGNPIDTLPSLVRLKLGTHRDGIYAGLDIPPGPVRVLARARVAGGDVTVGDFTATVFPDSVTIVSFGEPRPH